MAYMAIGWVVGVVVGAAGTYLFLTWTAAKHRCPWAREQLGWRDEP